jgi:hypothetical protein
MREQTWIVTETKPSDDIVSIGNILEVNYKLDWMLDGQVVTNSAVVSDNSNIGIKDEEYLHVGVDQLVLIISKNAQTSKIKRFKRLMIDSVPYQVEKIFGFTFKGAFKILLKEDVIRSTDSPTICDYYAETISSTENGIVGPSVIKKGTSESYSLIIDGVTVNPSWSVTPVDVNLTLDESNVEVLVSIGAELYNVGKQFVLTADYNDVVFTKDIKIVALF